MGWFRKSTSPSFGHNNSKLSYLRPQPAGCQQEAHVHHDWVPTESEFEQDVVALWAEAGAEAQLIFATLASTNNHIGYSSAAIHFFLSLTRSEVTWIHGKISDAGIHVSGATRQQLQILGNLETFELYERLANLADVASSDVLETKRKRQILAVLLSSGFFECIFWEAEYFKDEQFTELSGLLAQLPTLVSVFPVGAHLPCDAPDEKDRLFYQNALVIEETVVDKELEESNSEGEQLLGAQKYVLPNGQFIDTTKDHEGWLHVRRNAVSATDARKLVKLNGEVSVQRDKLIFDKLNDVRHDFESFELGVQREPIIANWVTENYPQEGFVANTYIYVGGHPRHVATPDMVGTRALCEIKVSTKPLKTCRTTYRDQLQWQMHVTGAEQVLLVVENRYSQEIETEWIPRNEARIEALVSAATSFLQDLDDSQAQKEKSAHLNIFESANEAAVEEADEPLVDAPLPTFELLAWDETQSALLMYCQGKDVFDIAEALGKTSNDIVATLGVQIFALDGELIDSSAENWGMSWSSEDATTLATLVRAGKTIDDICEALGRDRLGVLYRIFARLNPVVPLRVMKAFNVPL